jgi:hypothetical protein
MSEEDKNVFNSFEEASGSLGLSMLSQQLADVNQDWYPKWCSDDIKYCIVRDLLASSMPSSMALISSSDSPNSSK